MTKANTIDLGALQDDLENADRNLVRANTTSSNAYNTYIRAKLNHTSAMRKYSEAIDALRSAVDNLTV